jgi:hypothetical protein
MRLVAALAMAVFSLAPATAAPPPVETIIGASGLFGTWAADCSRPASAANPVVSVTMPEPGIVQEDHGFGDEFAANHYRILAAARLSSGRVKIGVEFQPGTAEAQRQILIVRVKDATRRTLFNEVEGGEIRVRDGVVLATGKKTPVLKKCG